MACGTAASAVAIRNLRCGKGMQIPALAFDQLSDTAKTCRGRAYHPRMGAREAEGQHTRIIFERLAALYEGMAVELERLSLKLPL